MSSIGQSFDGELQENMEKRERRELAIFLLLLVVFGREMREGTYKMECELFTRIFIQNFQS